MRKPRLAAGFTLIEIVAMLSLLTAVLAASLALLSQLTTISKKTMSQSLSVREIRRFVDQFRRDVHRSVEGIVEEQGKTFVIKDDDGKKVEYRFLPEGIGYVSEFQNPTQRDLFRIEPKSEAMFMVDSGERRVRVRLRSQAGDRQEWLVDAMMKEHQ